MTAKAPEVRQAIWKATSGGDGAGVAAPRRVRDAGSYAGDHELFAGAFAGDQFTYTTAMVQALLPLALDGPELPAAGRTESVRYHGDPAEGGNLLVMLIDVRSAVDRLPDRDRIYAEHAAGTLADSPWLAHVIAELLNG